MAFGYKIKPELPPYNITAQVYPLRLSQKKPMEALPLSIITNILLNKIKLSNLGSFFIS